MLQRDHEPEIQMNAEKMMKFYFKEWPDQTVTMMTPYGDVLWRFVNIGDALDAAREWYDINQDDCGEYYSSSTQDPSCSVVMID
jgi:hypothetical protein